MAEMSLGKVCYVAVYMILTVLLIVECAYSQRTYFRILSPIWKKDTSGQSRRWYSKVGSSICLSLVLFRKHNTLLSALNFFLIFEGFSFQLLIFLFNAITKLYYCFMNVLFICLQKYMTANENVLSLKW